MGWCHVSFENSTTGYERIPSSKGFFKMLNRLNLGDKPPPLWSRSIKTKVKLLHCCCLLFFAIEVKFQGYPQNL